MKKGLVHIYVGDGKGKTSAAMGLALRACGCGFDVSIFQFCKNTPTGELNSLRRLSHVSVQRACCELKKFVWLMTPEEKEVWADAQQTLFDAACEAACNPNVDVVVMDELLDALKFGVIDIAQIKYLITHKNKGTELVITGHTAPDALIETADYVTDMRCVKHPYQQGIDARRGIEM